MMDFYILNDAGEAVRTTDMAEWSAKFKASKRVAADEIGGLYISTVFLGIDHSHSKDGGPILFETMVFDYRDGSNAPPWAEQFAARYKTRADAILGHNAAKAALEAHFNGTKLLSG